jgi:hypothetical protein
MAGKWVIDDDHPAGHLVEMSADEEAQRDADEAASVEAAAAQTQALDARAARRARLEQARGELGDGDIIALLIEEVLS